MAYLEQFERLRSKTPRIGLQCVNNTNSPFCQYTERSKNCYMTFASYESEDCMYNHRVFYCTDCNDCALCQKCTLCYEFLDCLNCYNCDYCDHCENCTDSNYCYYCIGCKNCFGCVGLHQSKHCIFNKQYEQSEYERLVPRIIEHMRKTGEYGEFFPISTSPFAYNETLAQEHYPLTKTEALARGYRWRDEVPPTFNNITKTIAGGRLPDKLKDTPDDVLNYAIKCEEPGRLFQIQKAELTVYHKMGKPIPHLHFLERHKRRRALRNPQKLWKRACAKCNAEIRTSYSPERPDIVYCEKCYLEIVN